MDTEKSVLVPVSDLAAESMRDFHLADARQALRDSGAIMRDGHFSNSDGTSSRHRAVWVNPHSMFANPSYSWRIMSGLMNIIPGDMKENVHAVAGPVSGGAYLAKELAGLLSGNRDLKLPIVNFCQIDQKPGPEFYLRPYYRELVRGKKVILVDDVRFSGDTISTCHVILQNAGANVVGILLIVDGAPHGLPLGVSTRSVLELDFGSSYKPSECPMCKQGIPRTRF